MVNYEADEKALKQLLQGVETISGTFPPVYTYSDILISYDRLGQLRVIGVVHSEPPPIKQKWLRRCWTKLAAFISPVSVQPKSDNPGQAYRQPV